MHQQPQRRSRRAHTNRAIDLEDRELRAPPGEDPTMPFLILREDGRRAFGGGGGARGQGVGTSSTKSSTSSTKGTSSTQATASSGHAESESGGSPQEIIQTQTETVTQSTVTVVEATTTIQSTQSTASSSITTSQGAIFIQSVPQSSSGEIPTTQPSTTTASTTAALVATSFSNATPKAQTAQTGVITFGTPAGTNTGTIPSPNPSSTSVVSLSSATSTSHSKTGTAVGITIALIGLVIIGGFFYSRRRRILKRKASNRASSSWWANFGNRPQTEQFTGVTALGQDRDPFNASERTSRYSTSGDSGPSRGHGAPFMDPHSVPAISVVLPPMAQVNANDRLSIAAHSHRSSITYQTRLSSDSELYRHTLIDGVPALPPQSSSAEVEQWGETSMEAAPVISRPPVLVDYAPAPMMPVHVSPVHSYNPFPAFPSPPVSAATPKKQLIVNNPSPEPEQPFFFPLPDPSEASKIVKRPFTATEPDELTIIPGDVVMIQKVFDDGWASVMKPKTGEKGLIPLDALKELVAGGGA